MDAASSGNKSRILIIDDDTDNIRIISEALNRDGYQVNHANNGEEGLHKIKAWSPHLILLDVNMPALDGHSTLHKLRKQQDHDYTAVIFVSGNSSVEDIVKGLDLGADDYLVKPFRLPELLARIRAKLRIKELHDQLRRTTVRLEKMVEHDDLTGLYNMRHLYRCLDQEMLRARRYLKWIACIMMDLDQFKDVNDGHDHLFGSWVLAEVAKIIKDSSRNLDIAARYGGDEYIIILPETDVLGAERMAERIRRNIEATLFVHEQHQTRVTCSFGVAAVNGMTHAVEPRDFIRAADQMLYDAKNSGRNCVKSRQVTTP